MLNNDIYIHDASVIRMYVQVLKTLLISCLNVIFVV